VRERGARTPGAGPALTFRSGPVKIVDILQEQAKTVCLSVFRGGKVDRWPIVYIRGFAGPTTGINTQVEDPFYGFNDGSTHIRVAGDGAPAFYQFEGPLVRLIGDEQYKVYVNGSQEQLLDNPDPRVKLDPGSLWIYRFYDQAATTFQAPPHQNLAERLLGGLRQKVTADGFDIEDAAAGLYDFIMKIRAKTGAAKVYIVAH
jgi:hypothetical protein